MSQTKYTPTEGLFYVDIEHPSQEEINGFYIKTSELKLSGTSNNAPRIFKKAIIKHTCDQKHYPVGSVWMMGEVPGMVVNFFGEKIIIVQQKDLYARIN